MVPPVVPGRTIGLLTRLEGSVRVLPVSDEVKHRVHQTTGTPPEGCQLCWAAGIGGNDMVVTRAGRAMETTAREAGRGFAPPASPDTLRCGALWQWSVWGGGLQALGTTLSTTIDTGLCTCAPPSSPPPVSLLLSPPVPLCPPPLLGRCLGDGGGASTGPLPSVFRHGGGQCLHFPSGRPSVIRAVHLYPPSTNGHASQPTTPAVPHSGVRYTVGHPRSPCGADASLAGPNERYALPGAPH